MELFHMLPNKSEEIVRKVARLCAEGHPEEADIIIKTILSQN
jgi:hypothetical protein